MITFKQFLLEGDYSDKELADDFIKGWTFDHTTHRNSYDSKQTQDGFEVARKVYPFKTGGKIYRGYYFKNEKDRDAFHKQIKTGTLSDKSLSSWTRSMQQALNFSLLDGETYEELPGFILSMKPPVGTKMVNAGKSKHGESEIIVDAGTFEVKIEKSFDDPKPKVDENDPEVIWKKYKGDPAELKKHEEQLSKDYWTAFYYARDVLKGPFKLGEPAIATNADYSRMYAEEVLKGPFKLGEPAIAKSPWDAKLYAMTVLKGRFELGEPAMARSKDANREYQYFLKTLK